ncbi:MAG: polysaccharide deacetylase family protein [Myxococcales bacterium]|nr:polysaccharide deacetylase family protein [Myxococcales bacterium]MCB9530369.1 polysaccharide deacetylase family protein [Myxococcales bacterium]
MNARAVARRATIAANAIAPFAAGALAFAGEWGAAVGTVAAAHAAWMVPTLWPAAGAHGVVTTRLAREELWLTIDDGPHETDTPALLDVLDQAAVRATFFFIGERAARHPELVAEVVRRGHDLGNHTWSHPQYRFWASGPRGVREEILRCQDVLESLSGHRPRWFRAPAGLKNPWVFEVTEREGLDVACWSARGLDGISYDVDRAVARIAQALSPGGVVLVHEAQAGPERIATRVLHRTLDAVAERGLRFGAPPRSAAGAVA